MCQLLDLQEHCHLLSSLLLDCQLAGPPQRHGEVPTSFDAADWLALAASVREVDVLTGRFDSCLMFCGRAMEYEEARSELLSEIVAKLTVFTFTWGAFEIVARIINPPSIPRGQQVNGANGPLDRTIYSMRGTTPLAAYRDVLVAFSEVLASDTSYGAPIASGRVAPYAREASMGIDAVRKIRNKFAHGALAFPPPEDWSESTPTERLLFPLSSRIVLFTIQMLLIKHLREENVDVSVLRDKQGRLRTNVCYALSRLHLANSGVHQRQLRLLPASPGPKRV